MLKRRRLWGKRGRKTTSFSKGSVFFSAGLGGYGPYVLLRRRIGPGVGVKISAGTRGIEIGSDFPLTKDVKADLRYNLNKKQLYVKLKKTKR